MLSARMAVAPPRPPPPRPPSGIGRVRRYLRAAAGMRRRAHMAHQAWRRCPTSRQRQRGRSFGASRRGRRDNSNVVVHVRHRNVPSVTAAAGPRIRVAINSDTHILDRAGRRQRLDRLTELARPGAILSKVDLQLPEVGQSGEVLAEDPTGDQPPFSSSCSTASRTRRGDARGGGGRLSPSWPSSTQAGRVGVGARSGGIDGGVRDEG